MRDEEGEGSSRSIFGSSQGSFQRRQPMYVDSPRGSASEAGQTLTSLRKLGSSFRVTSTPLAAVANAGACGGVDSGTGCATDKSGLMTTTTTTTTTTTSGPAIERGVDAAAPLPGPVDGPRKGGKAGGGTMEVGVGAANGERTPHAGGGGGQDVGGMRGLTNGGGRRRRVNGGGDGGRGRGGSEDGRGGGPALGRKIVELRAQNMLKRGQIKEGEVEWLRGASQGVAVEDDGWQWCSVRLSAQDNGRVEVYFSGEGVEGVEGSDGIWNGGTEGKLQLGNVRECFRVEGLEVGGKQHVMRLRWKNGGQDFVACASEVIFSEVEYAKAWRDWHSGHFFLIES